MMQKGLALSLDAITAILIICIMTSIVAVKSSSFLDSARVSRAQSDTAALGGYISEYKMEIGSYPDALSTLTQTNGQYKPWISKVPTDPWGNAYQYKKNTSKFIVYSLGIDQSDSGSSVENGVANNDIGFSGR